MDRGAPIAPLIPLPSTNSQPQNTDDKEDLFASLFSPPTPRASPEPNTYRQDKNPHVRTQSTDSDFGAFVSVSASEDPLGFGGDEDSEPFTPAHNGFFDKFGVEAKAASERNRHEVLDELLRHEDDPLGWLKGVDPAPSSSGRVSRAALEDALADFDPLSTHHAPETRTHDTPSDSVHDLLVDISSAPAPSSDERGRGNSDVSSTHPGLASDSTMAISIEEGSHRRRAHTNSHPSTSPVTRSPSLPPSSPTRISRPEIQRTQSSYFTPTNLPSRWVSNLLSSTIRTPRTGPSTPPTASSIFGIAPDDEETSALGPPPSALGRFGAFASRSAPHSRAPTFHDPSASSSASTLATGPDLDATITHGTPFGAHVFVPAAGAPGFAGDSKWDKGFEFDKDKVEKRSVRLVGRREGTVGVLNVEVADRLRPHLPALARLPKSWSLLYSLDQHGISLNTLYTRCATAPGGALLVVRDAGDGLFGAWVGEGIRMGKGAYYGSGQSFLWQQQAGADGVRVFKWTGKNDYVALCEPDYISFGGGDGRYGLWLDDALTDGSSARCPTFENEPLCSSTGARNQGGGTFAFECVGLEVWGIG